jgi:hypothetical protein
MNLTIALAESVERQQAAETSRFNEARAALAERAETEEPATRRARTARRLHWSHRVHGARIAH